MEREGETGKERVREAAREILRGRAREVEGERGKENRRETARER